MSESMPRSMCCRMVCILYDALQERWEVSSLTAHRERWEIFFGLDWLMRCRLCCATLEGDVRGVIYELLFLLSSHERKNRTSPGPLTARECVRAIPERQCRLPPRARISMYLSRNYRFPLIFFLHLS